MEREDRKKQPKTAGARRGNICEQVADRLDFQAAESLIARSSGKEALDHAIQAVELYMRAAGEATDKSEATRLRRHCQKLIAYAEDLKARLSLVPSTGRDILNQVSSLHGNDFPPWQSDPVEAEFQLPLNGELFT